MPELQTKEAKEVAEAFRITNQQAHLVYSLVCNEKLFSALVEVASVVKGDVVDTTFPTGEILSDHRKYDFNHGKLTGIEMLITRLDEIAAFVRDQARERDKDVR